MTLSIEKQEKVKKIIIERAYEIETRLSEDNYSLARMAGLRPDQVSNTALKLSIKELQKEFA